MILHMPGFTYNTIKIKTLKIIISQYLKIKSFCILNMNCTVRQFEDLTVKN